MNKFKFDLFLLLAVFSINLITSTSYSAPLTCNQVFKNDGVLKILNDFERKIRQGSIKRLPPKILDLGTDKITLSEGLLTIADSKAVILDLVSYYNKHSNELPLQSLNHINVLIELGIDYRAIDENLLKQISNPISGLKGNALFRFLAGIEYSVIESNHDYQAVDDRLLKDWSMKVYSSIYIELADAVKDILYSETIEKQPLTLFSRVVSLELLFSSCFLTVRNLLLQLDIKSSSDISQLKAIFNLVSYTTLSKYLDDNTRSVTGKSVLVIAKGVGLTETQIQNYGQINNGSVPQDRFSNHAVSQAKSYIFDSVLRSLINEGLISIKN